MNPNQKIRNMQCECALDTGRNPVKPNNQDYSSIKEVVKTEGVRIIFLPPSSEKLPSSDKKESKVNAFLTYQPEVDGRISTFKLAFSGAKETTESETSKNSKKHVVSCDLSSSGVTGHWKVTDKGIEYICDMDMGKCKRSFTTIAYLKSHQHVHFSRQLKCTECGRKFVWANHLNYHMKAHKGLKQFKCYSEGCDKSFCTAQQRIVHYRTHTGKKPYVCELCKKGFTTLQNMNNHVRTHTGEKPFACDFAGCNKKFAEVSSLKKHTVTHTGEKPHKCVHCQKCFTQTSTLKWHIRRYHTENAPPTRSIANIQAQQKAAAEARKTLLVDSVTANSKNCEVQLPAQSISVKDEPISFAEGEQVVFEEVHNNIEVQYVGVDILQNPDLGNCSSEELNSKKSPFIAVNHNTNNVVVLSQSTVVPATYHSETVNYNTEQVDCKNENNSYAEIITYHDNTTNFNGDQEEVIVSVQDPDYNEIYKVPEDVQSSDYNIFEDEETYKK